ncbi:bifunctional phosphopantothenoylcysteine decarboxylase/phosphopantothenate--cysteine ligase CoaBC [Faecalispora jeddahensis]|uniref:bifunctional phosphopantothenoylcysteine decarboxylase/phosphopantothenate--cysteine ligase CoaBC n=1 Tax=Faecalispora jeddahensis TaxID=1414721 RepID=UPI00145AB5D7|nr:bifunctional phosphopantothenoylcysteine decarboxylase/phosphopantothenate--cysteine ligase CoaBC [Faecalispora jeddahensis]
MKHVLLGVTGSIAAYKAAEIANILTKQGCEVDVILTKSAQEFITPLTFQTLTKRKVYTKMFDEILVNEVEHISLAKRADVCVVAPATANLIGKLASGIADDMLTTVLTAVRGTPVILCPAMNTAMYENEIVQENIRRLKKHGTLFIEPKEGLLACGDLGRGALAEVETITETVLRYLKEKED